jgi:oligoendopeptidase F
MFAEFERNIHKYCEQGTSLTMDLLCEEYLKLNKKQFSPVVKVDETIKYEWARIPHFYYHFYVYKYATGLSIASYIASEILNGNKELLAKYLDFLKIGCKMKPREALMTMNIDITKKDVVERAINMFDEFIDEANEILE